MKRKILGAVLGFFAWWVVATVLDRLLRLAWPHYAEVLKAFAFTLGMLIARLVEGAASTLAAGFVAAWVARKPGGAALATGVLLLALFVPTHAMIWDKFPVWYHLLFLSSLVPLTLLGARLLPARSV
ncbi:MAG TPA: hypothetical protein VGI39_23005 [Polyangiaceae bacterium]|jgi:hypothetical protein